MQPIKQPKMTKTDPLTAVNFIRRFLAIVGLWPERTRSFWSELKTSITLLCCIIFVILNVVEVIFHFSDFKTFAENFSVTVPVFTFIFKVVVMKTHRFEFFAMYDLIHSSETFRNYPKVLDIYVENSVNLSIQVTKVYAAICAFVDICYGILSLRSEQVLPIKLDYSFGRWIYGVWFFQMVTICNVASSTVTLDMLATSFMGVAIAQLDILKQKLLNFSGKTDDGEIGEEEEKIIDENLRKCVQHHCEIIGYVEAVEATFTWLFLTQYLNSIFSICNIGFQLAHIDPFSAEFTNMACFLTAMMCQLAMYCWFGNEIIIKSLEVSDACYSSNWRKCDRKIKKSLMMIRERAARPLAVTPGKFSKLSLASLASIMNASYSYFTLMQRLYKKDQ